MPGPRKEGWVVVVCVGGGVVYAPFNSQGEAIDSEG